MTLFSNLFSSLSSLSLSLLAIFILEVFLFLCMVLCRLANFVPAVRLVVWVLCQGGRNVKDI